MANLSNINNKFLVTTGGNVGIGVTGPSAKLHIDANSGVLTQEILKVKGGGSGGAFGFLVEANNGDDLFKVDTSTYNCFFPSSFTKVGIGTDSPNAKLKIEGNGATNGLSIKSGGNGGTYPLMVTWTGGAEGDTFCVDAYLNVGIGTTSPGTYGPATGTVKLDVKSGDIIRSGFNNPANSWIGFTSLPGYAANSYPCVTSKSSLHFANNDKYCAYLEGTDTYFGILNSALNTKVFLATGAQNSYLSGTGNFGVGVTGPLAKLHVVGGTVMTGGWGRSIFLEDTYPAIVWGSNATKYAACAYDHSVDAMRWYTGAATSDATQSANLRMSLKAGNLGIGTDSPSAKLQVSGDIATAVDGNAYQLYYTEVRDFITNSGATAIIKQIDNDASAGRIDFRSYTNSTIMTVMNSGNVGIGTTGPSARLNVVGVGQANNPTVAIDVTNSDSFNHGLEIFDGNLTTGETVLMAIGHSGSTKLTAIFGFVRNESSLDQNLATIGFWGADNKLTVSGGGNVGIGTSTAVPGAKLEVSADVAKGILISRSFTTSSQTLANVRAYYGLAITPLRGGTGGLYFTNYDADVPIIQSVNTSNVAQSLLLNPLGGNIGIGTTSPTGVVGSGQGGNTTLDVQGPLKNKRVMRGWHHCNPITSSNAYRHIKTNLHMGGGARGNDEYIMGGFEIKGYAYYGSYPGFGHGTCMFHNWSNSFASLQVANYGTTGFVQQPYVSSDGYCVLVLRANTYMQPVIDFSQYYTPYPWRTAYVTAEISSPNLTGVY